MPRPKVRPEERQRSSQACIPCKASKIRCDSQVPCAACNRRKRPASCIYAGTDHRRRIHRDVNRTPSRPRNAFTNCDIIAPALTHEAAGIEASRSIAFSPATGTLEPGLTDDGSAQLHQIELSVGSKDACGTASLSFLYFLRRTLRPFIGPTAFTEGRHQNFVPEKDINEQDAGGEADYSSEQLYSLLDSYFEATSGLLDLLTADEIDAFVAAKATAPHTSTTTSIRAHDLAAFNVALAIGTQVHPPGKFDPNVGEALISKAMPVAFEGMLATPSISMVRLFLLLAFYMIGACRRSAASMYMAVAARAAVLLGLDQIGAYRGLPFEEYDRRSRTWNSLRILDVLTSFILGRSRSLPEVWHHPSQSDISAEGLPQTGNFAFRAVSEGCRLVEEIVQKLSSGNVLHVPTAELLLGNLRQWTRSLPDTARVFTFSDGSQLESADYQALIGNIHISCVYYFAVMLITRPFLIAYLVSRLRGKAPDHLINDPDEATDVQIKNNTVSKLAQVCVSSAIYMADMCQKVRQAGYDFRNLCLLKAWIFGSGLILGFSMFAGEPRSDIDIAFHSTLEVLKSISEASPQAQIYHKILASFLETVVSYRKRVAGEVNRTVQYYMDQIMVVEHIRDISCDRATTESRASYIRQDAVPIAARHIRGKDDFMGSQADGTGDQAFQFPQFDSLFESPDLVLEFKEFETFLYSVE